MLQISLRQTIRNPNPLLQCKTSLVYSQLVEVSLIVSLFRKYKSKSSTKRKTSLVHPQLVEVSLNVSLFRTFKAYLLVLIQ